MREAYFKLMLDEEIRDLTTFSDEVTLYRCKRLPFGLTCSPAIFSRRMASLLTQLLRKGWVKNYLDELFIFAPRFQELLVRLKELFPFFTGNGLNLNLSKCTYSWSQGGHFPWASYFCRRQPTRSKEHRGCKENETSHKRQGSMPIFRHVWFLP